MTLVGDLIAKVHDDFVESFEVLDVLGHHLLGGGVCLSAHESVEGLLVVGDNFPGCPDGGKYFR